MNYPVVFSSIAIIIGVLCYIPYLRDIFKNKTKPHLYTWFLWSILSGTAFVIRLRSGAGAGSWPNLVGSIMSAVVFVLAIRKGEKNITFFDTVCFVTALLSILIWLIYHNGLYAIILVVIADMLAFIITIVKTYKKPFQETKFTYFLNGIKWALTLAATQVLSWTNVILPLYLTIFNFGFVIMIMSRRRKLS